MAVKTKVVVKRKDSAGGTTTGGYANTGNNITINQVGGDYLPAKSTDNGKYEVNLSLVKFIGNIEATGSITAHTTDPNPEATIMDEVICDNITIHKNLTGALEVIGGTGGGGGTFNEAQMWEALKKVNNNQIDLSHITPLTQHINDNIIHVNAGDKINWNDAWTKRHEHDNKTVLDGITDKLVKKWTNKAEKYDIVGKHTANSGEIFNTALEAWDTAHAEGNGTRATGSCSHSEGVDTHAEGNGSHAEGDGSHAIGDYSHAAGNRTIARNAGETAVGVYNSSTKDITCFSIGIGTGDNGRRNAIEVTKDGKLYVNGIGNYFGWNLPEAISLDEAIKDVDSSKKLSNTHTIFGHSFDGTQDVNGEINDVTNINATGNIKCATVLATGEITAYSDKRLKTDIVPLEDRGRLRPVTYVKDCKKSIGFIAQDVQEKYPELVVEKDGYLTLNYQQITAVLAAQLNKAMDRIAVLENKLNILEK